MAEVRWRVLEPNCRIASQSIKWASRYRAAFLRASKQFYTLTQTLEDLEISNCGLRI